MNVIQQMVNYLETRRRLSSIEMLRLKMLGLGTGAENDVERFEHLDYEYYYDREAELMGEPGEPEFGDLVQEMFDSSIGLAPRESRTNRRRQRGGRGRRRRAQRRAA